MSINSRRLPAQWMERVLTDLETQVRHDGKTVMDVIARLIQQRPDTAAQLVADAVSADLLGICADCVQPYLAPECPRCGGTALTLSDDDLSRMWGV